MVLPWYVDAVKKRGRGFTVGEGKNVASVIHVRDLSAAFILLVEEALEGEKAEWGEKGWYYVDGGEYVFAEVAGAIVKAIVGRGLVKEGSVDVLSAEEGKSIHPYAELIWGMNMRINGERIRGLGWRAKEGDVFSTISELLVE